MFDSQYLSVPFMAAISGFPLNWTECLLEPKRENQEEFVADSSTAEQSFPSKQPLPSSESNIFTPCVPGKQWLDPARIILKGGTQSRDVNEVYEANVATVQHYAELMKEGLWDWERQPLPVAFVAADGKIYAGDCHHRASAAIAAGKQIYIDLRPGELIDAILFSCRANTDHGLPLRAKDQRKRIELFLDTLAKLDEARSHQLLQSTPGLTDIERRNGKWSARVIAKYLKLTESSYRTVINIVQEREMALAFSQFAEGDWVRIKPHYGGDIVKFAREGTTGRIHSFDKRKGVFIVPVPGTLDIEGRMLPSFYVDPDCIEKTEAPPLMETGKNTQPEPTSIEQELEQQAEAVGLPNDVQVLPDVERNQGDPDTLVDDRPFATPGLAVDEVEEFVSKVDQLPPEQIDKVWTAIAPRIPLVDIFSIGIESLDNEDLQELVSYANELLTRRQEEAVNAS